MQDYVLVIGGGIAGMTAAYYYAKRGFSVVIFEAGARLGGLLQTDTIKLPYYPSFRIEYFYHHFFETDSALLALLEQLGISSSIHFVPVKNSFNALITRDKLALGLLLLYPTYRGLKNISVADYLRRFRTYKYRRSYLDRLVRAKFGRHADDINLGWLWARLHARFTLSSLIRGERLGVIVPSTQQLLDSLLDELKILGVRIKVNSPVRALMPLLLEYRPVRVVITTPVHIAKQIVNDTMVWNWGIPEYLGAINVVFFMDPKRYAYPFYWTNLDMKANEPPFLVRVEQSLLNYRLPVRVVYLGMYLDSKSPYWGWTNDQLIAYLERRFPELTDGKLGTRVYRVKAAQHVPTVEYVKDIPPRVLGNIYYGDGQKTTVELFSFGNLYPWDRGVNFAIYHPPF